MAGGAVFTSVHVSRSAELLCAQLPSLAPGIAEEAVVELIHCTGFERNLRYLRLRGYHARKLGAIIGTADLLAQMADPGYLDKVPQRLHPELVQAGLFRGSAEDLLRGTPGFIRSMFRERLDGAFGSAYRHLDVALGNRNPYLESIERHLATLAARDAESGQRLSA